MEGGISPLSRARSPKNAPSGDSWYGSAGPIGTCFTRPSNLLWHSYALALIDLRLCFDLDLCIMSKSNEMLDMAVGHRLRDDG